MTSLEKGLREFAQFAAKLKGDEKSDAQTFLFHLLAAFGHDPNTLSANGWSLRDLYRSLETPGANRRRDAHAAFNSLVFRGEDRVRIGCAFPLALPPAPSTIPPQETLNE